MKVTVVKERKNLWERESIIQARLHDNALSDQPERKDLHRSGMRMLGDICQGCSTFWIRLINTCYSRCDP